MFIFRGNQSAVESGHILSFVTDRDFVKFLQMHEVEHVSIRLLKPLVRVFVEVKLSDDQDFDYKEACTFSGSYHATCKLVSTPFRLNKDARPSYCVYYEVSRMETFLFRRFHLQKLCCAS